MIEALIFVAGYIASVYSWPGIRAFVTGADSELARLKDRVKALESEYL